MNHLTKVLAIFQKTLAHICIAIDFWEVMLFYALRKQYPNSKFSLIRIFPWLTKVKSLEDQNKLQIFLAVMNILSAIRDKGESQDVCYKNITKGTFPKNKHFLPPDTHKHACVSGIRNVHFSENLACFVFVYIRFKTRPLTLTSTVQNAK